MEWANLPSAESNSRPTPVMDSRELKILNMFDRGSLPTITESVVYLADSGIMLQIL